MIVTTGTGLYDYSSIKEPRNQAEGHRMDCGTFGKVTDKSCISTFNSNLS